MTYERLVTGVFVLPLVFAAYGGGPNVGIASGAPPLCAPQVHRVPCAAGVKIGVEYRYTLWTHCGIRDVYLDGRLWVATPPLSDGSGNPPRGWGNPWQRGTIRLLARARAEFRGGAGPLARFAPAPKSYRLGICI